MGEVSNWGGAMGLGVAMWKRIVDIAACYYLDAGADPSERRLVEDLQAARDES